MFGYVSVSPAELTEAEKLRYSAVYCGICRRIREQSSQLARVALRYDMAFLALLLMSLYEPEEQSGRNACLLHPLRKRPWLDNIYIRYAADMNVALAYYNCLDNWQDDRKLTSRAAAGLLKKDCLGICGRYPRQCAAIADCTARLRALEAAGCPNPDEPANCFGGLMAELLVYHEDLWAPTLRDMGMALGRFIYLADAAADYPRDKRKQTYNPYLAMGMEADWPRWEEYLILALGSCTACFERLPLVQDKPLLDNILYSGVWANLGKKRKEENA